jgi:predicted deacylase
MNMQISSINVDKGQKKTVFLTAAELPIGKIEIPVTIINGFSNGPTLAVTSGIHGTEYPGIRAAQIISSELKPTEINGTLIVLNCANVPMFNAKTAFVNPIDDTNFNRIFPGQPIFTGFYGPGTISHHITNFIYENVLKQATHFIDLHGGDLPELVPFFAISSETGDELKDKDTKAMLKYTLADYILLTPPSQSLSTTGAASRAHIPNTLIEAGGAGILKIDDVTRHVNGVKNIMRYLGMLEGKPIEPKKQRKIGQLSAGIRSKHGGFFVSLVEPGDIVDKDQLIGIVTNAFGETIDEVKSPLKGVVNIINFLAAKNTGDPLFSVAELLD